MKRFLIEAFVIFGVVIAAIMISDKRRIFNQDESNNHTGQCWDALYSMKKRHCNVDIMILGNSHSYCGLLPEVIEEQTGAKCFILASQGNFATDSYYMLEEALTLVKPKVLVVETYILRDYRQKKLKAGDLSCQFQSFENRRNVFLKLRSTPRLFTPDGAPYAWSRTLRNHSYLFENPEQLKFNLEHPYNTRPFKKDYKGRFIKFTTGLTEPTLERYRREGAPVDGQKYIVSEEAVKACDRIRQLCREKGIQLVFLTIPMYKDHICNTEAYRKNLSKAVGDDSWLNLQQPEFLKYYDENCFEDTYKQNQHLTSTGAYVSSMLLSQCFGGN